MENLKSQETIVIIGAGILGLTAAIRLQESVSRSTNILIAAREFPFSDSINYTTPWAGAHYRPIPASTPQLASEHVFAKVTYSVIKQQTATDPAAGIKFVDAIEYIAKPDQAYHPGNPGYLEYAAIDGFRHLDRSELPPDINWGVTYKTWCINPPVYCEFLLRRFLLKGGKKKTVTLSSAEEAFTLVKNVKTVVNCSGFGFGDPAVFPTRGQTVLVSNPCDINFTQQNADGTWTFIIPRPLDGGTIIGGTKEPGDWYSLPSLATREKLLNDVAKMYPEILNADGGFDVIRDIVGRRPTRTGGLRMEVEWVQKPTSEAGKRIVHAYGAGGRGFELSWGIADEVVNMVHNQKLIAKSSL